MITVPGDCLVCVVFVVIGHQADVDGDQQGENESLDDADENFV